MYTWDRDQEMCPDLGNCSDPGEKSVERVLNRFLSMPRLEIFLSSVWRGIPSLLAAPAGPEMRPLLWASAASIISRSRSASVGISRTTGPDAGPDSGLSQLSSIENVAPSQRITARSIIF